MAAVAAAAAPSPLYPKIEPFQSGRLQVTAIHNLYYEQCGNPAGQPVVFVHGGPGGGIGPDDRRYFDPSFYRIVLFDQRGAGKSTPSACLEDNTTWALVGDMEALRKLLNIEKWVVFGGSWGSTLALAYAETHPTRVESLILRGIFTLRQKELVFFYQEGASFLFPDYWEGFLEPIPLSERHDLMNAYHRRLTGTDKAVQLRCATAWSTWECATSKLFVDPAMIAKADEPEWALAFARIECHYFVNAGFFEYDGQLLAEAHKIKHIPTVIVQGRYDVVCPMYSAWALHRALPDAKLVVVNDAGHSAKELGTCAELVKACDQFRDFVIKSSGGSRPSSASSSQQQQQQQRSPLPAAGASRPAAGSPPRRGTNQQQESPIRQDNPLGGQVPHLRRSQPPGGFSHNILG